MAKKITLQVSESELLSIIDVFETIDSMTGGSEPFSGNGSDDWDTEMKKHIKKFDKMLLRHGYKR